MRSHLLRHWNRSRRDVFCVLPKVSEFRSVSFTQQTLDPRMLPSNNIPSKSQSFSIVWSDDTDTICNLSCLLTYLDNFASSHHKTDTTRSPTTARSARRGSNGVTVPSSLPSSSCLPHSPLFPHNAFVTVLEQIPAPTPGILADIHSRPGDLVDT